MEDSFCDLEQVKFLETNQNFQVLSFKKFNKLIQNLVSIMQKEAIVVKQMKKIKIEDKHFLKNASPLGRKVQVEIFSSIPETIGSYSTKQIDRKKEKVRKGCNK